MLSNAYIDRSRWTKIADIPRAVNRRRVPRPPQHLQRLLLVAGAAQPRLGAGGRQAEERDDGEGQSPLLPGPEGELARALSARLADDHARRAALTGRHTSAGHDRVPRRAHRPARRVRLRRARLQTGPARGPASARRLEELLLRRRAEQSRHLHAHLGGEDQLPHGDHGAGEDLAAVSRYSRRLLRQDQAEPRRPAAGKIQQQRAQQ